MASKGDTFPALTGLRFIAAISVVIGHAVPKLFPIKDAPIPSWHQFLTSMPALGMPLFFMLSGFVIFYNYSNILDERPASGLWRFFVDRFSRLYPLYALALAVSLVHQWGFSALPEDTARYLPFYLTLTQTWFYGVAGDRSAVYIFGGMPTIAWSIATEWFFYLAFPFIAAAIIRIRTVAGCIFAALMMLAAWCGLLAVILVNTKSIDVWATEIWGPVAGLAYARTISSQSFIRWLTYLSPYISILCFIIGCLVAAVIMRVAGRQISSREKRLSGWITLAAIGVTVTVLVRLYTLDGSSIANILRSSHLAVIPSIAVLIYCCARYQNPLVRLLSSSPMVQLGEASYALYLLHIPIVNAFRWEAAPMRSWEIGVGDLARAVPFVFAVIGASLFSYQYIEMPAQRALRRLLLPKRKAASVPLNEPAL